MKEEITAFQFASLFNPSCTVKEEGSTTEAPFQAKNCPDLGRMCQSAFGSNEEDVRRCVQITSSTGKTPLSSYRMDDLVSYCDGKKAPPLSLVDPSKSGVASFPLPTTNTCVWNTNTKQADHIGARKDGNCRQKDAEEHDRGCNQKQTEKECDKSLCEWNPATSSSSSTIKATSTLTCKPRLNPFSCHFKTEEEERREEEERKEKEELRKEKELVESKRKRLEAEEERKKERETQHKQKETERKSGTPHIPPFQLLDHRTGEGFYCSKGSGSDLKTGINA